MIGHNKSNNILKKRYCIYIQTRHDGMGEKTLNTKEGGAMDNWIGMTMPRLQLMITTRANDAMISVRIPSSISEDMLGIGSDEL